MCVCVCVVCVCVCVCVCELDNTASHKKYISLCFRSSVEQVIPKNIVHTKRVLFV